MDPWNVSNGEWKEPIAAPAVLTVETPSGYTSHSLNLEVCHEVMSTWHVQGTVGSNIQ